MEDDAETTGSAGEAPPEVTSTGSVRLPARVNAPQPAPEGTDEESEVPDVN